MSITQTTTQMPNTNQSDNDPHFPLSFETPRTVPIKKKRSMVELGKSGDGKRSENSPSRFLNDIEEALKEIKQREFKKKIKETKKHNQIDLF